MQRRISGTLRHGGDIINIDSLYFILASTSTYFILAKTSERFPTVTISCCRTKFPLPPTHPPPPPPRHTSSRDVRITDNRRRHRDNGHSGFSARRSTRHLRTNGLCQREHRTRLRPPADAHERRDSRRAADRRNTGRNSTRRHRPRE